MKYLDWSDAKNIYLKMERGVSFEEVQAALDEGRLLDNIAHLNQVKYPKQRMLIVEINNYTFIVPFIEDEEKIFLKTIYPSRKFTNKYIKNRRTK